MIALEFDDVHAAYGPYKALNGLSAVIAEGESVALLGRNGVGKSTFARVASGLVPITQGRLVVLGRPVRRTAPHVLARMGVVHLPEGVGLFTGLTIDENLRLRVGGRSGAERRKRHAVALSQLPAPLRARRRVKAGLLSGGQQRLVAVTAALAASPRVLICDEPALGLAPAAAADVYAELAKHRETGGTLVVIETRLDRVEGLCERSLVLDTGKVAFDGPTSGAADALGALLRGSAAASLSAEGRTTP
jgi:branched-chain amino acid transport system ATP-binding protein